MKTSRRLLIVAVILGVMTVVALQYYLKGNHLEAPAATVKEYTNVVVAKSSIPQHTRITVEMLELGSVSSDAVHPEALRNVDDAVGGISRSEIIRGEQVLGNRVVTEESRASLSYRVPEKMRGISIPIGDVTGVSGYISPGDKVDVLVAYNDPNIAEVPTVYTVVQNVLVLATGEFTNEMDNEERRLVGTATLVVTPAQAEILAYATLKGTFHLTLRSPLDEDIERLDYYSSENFETFRER